MEGWGWAKVGSKARHMWGGFPSVSPAVGTALSVILMGVGTQDEDPVGSCELFWQLVDQVGLIEL